MRNATRPLPAGEQVTMLEAGEELCRRLEIRGRKKSNRLTVASDLRNHIVPFLGDRELDRIEPKDVERYIAVKLGTLAPMAAAKICRRRLNTPHSWPVEKGTPLAGMTA